MAKRRDVEPVGVSRVYPDAGDVAGVLEADVLPGRPGVGGAVDAVAVGDVAAYAGLAHSGVYDRGIGVRHGERAYGGGAEEAVGDVAPVRTAVGGLPDAARARSEVEGLPLVGVARHGHDASAPVRPYRAPPQCAEMLRSQSEAHAGILPPYSRGSRWPNGVRILSGRVRLRPLHQRSSCSDSVSS